MNQDITKSPKQKSHVLLVDDDPLIIRMYQKKLTTDGYRVETATTGNEALAHILHDKPDVVLLDVMMPELNGVETLKILKKNPSTADIPVIILTNLGDNEADVENAKRLGARDYLVKSRTKLSALSARVAEVIGESH